MLESILTAIFDDVLGEPKFGDRFDVSSPWNIYLIHSASGSGVQDITDQVVVQHQTVYNGLLFSLFTNCDLEEPCACERHNPIIAWSTIGHAAAAAIRTMSLGIPPIVMVPPTPTPSATAVYNWDW
jgi:hypothetical protein